MTAPRDAVATALAAAFLDGGWTSPAALAGRGSTAVGVRQSRLTPTAIDVLATYRDPPFDRRRELAAFIAALPSFARLWIRDQPRLPDRPGARGERVRRAPRPNPPRVVEHRLPTSAMVVNRWHVPTIDTVAALAEWAGLSVARLDWHADVKSLERVSAAALLHYDRSWVSSRRGSVRLLERPRPRLKELQRRVLHDVLDLIPAHEAAHGFVPGRSVATYAAPHVDGDVVLRLDLEAFFATIAAGRVFGIFRLAGYPEPVAHLLTGLATTVLPYADRRLAPTALRDEDLPARRRLLDRLGRPHLPQGAPTSPALANLVAYRLDARLAGLAASTGARYTRYADDLALSLAGPDAARRASRLVEAVREIVAAEGFRLNPAKTRIATRSQRQLVCGVVVNAQLSILRRERDELRAILHNCRAHGAPSQNRRSHPDFRSHLLGRIAWVSAVNSAQGARLRAQFDAISQW